jgi:hypothetical protein
LENANTQVDYSHRFIFKQLIRFNNQIKKHPLVQAEEAKWRSISDLVYIGLHLLGSEVAENYKTGYDHFISAPIRELETKLDTANGIIDSIEWKELYLFYKDSKQLGLTQANTRWKPKIKPVHKFPKYRILGIYEKKPDEQSN